MLKKKIIIEPNASNKNTLIHFSPAVTITKKTYIRVPVQYKAIAFIEQKPLFRIDTHINNSLIVNYGKDFLGKQLRVAFIALQTSVESPWGFGNILINNGRHKETCRIGANGNFSIRITDYTRLIQAFQRSNDITIDDIREKLISTIKAVGATVLGDYFSNAKTSVFETCLFLDDFRCKFMSTLKAQNIFQILGIELATLTVNRFHINEDDLKTIKTQ